MARIPNDDDDDEPDYNLDENDADKNDFDYNDFDVSDEDAANTLANGHPKSRRPSVFK